MARFQDPGGLRCEASGLGLNFHSDGTLSCYLILGLFILQCCKTIENQRALVLEGVLLCLVQKMTRPQLRGWLEPGGTGLRPLLSGAGLLPLQ